jgi:hypothetical protein
MPAPKAKARPVLAPKAKALPHTLEDILNEFGPLDEVQFDPFIPEAYTQARAILPHSFPLIPQLFDYFSLFLTGGLWQTITTNTNRYAAFQQRTNLNKLMHREWKDLIPEELHVLKKM